MAELVNKNDYAEFTDNSNTVLLEKDSLVIVPVHAPPDDFIAFADNFGGIVEDNDVSSNFDDPWNTDNHFRHEDNDIPRNWGWYFQDWDINIDPYLKQDGWARKIAKFQEINR